MKALFHPTLKEGRISPRRMSDQAVLNILRQRGEQAQVSEFSPHDFRHTFISNLLDAGADISTVQIESLHKFISNIYERINRTPAAVNNTRIIFRKTNGFIC